MNDSTNETQAFNAEQHTAVGNRGQLKDGRDYYVPIWSARVAFENLIQAGKLLGQDSLVRVCLEEKQDVAMTAGMIMAAEDHALTVALVENFVSSMRVDGTKVAPNTIDKIFGENLYAITEAFCIVLKSQYTAFFTAALDVEPSPAK